MPNRMKLKGDRAERAVKDIAAANGFPWCERLKAGDQRDKGDLWLCPGVIVQVKDRKRLAIPQWLRELAKQKANARAEVAVLAVKHGPRSGMPRWSATMPHPEMLSLLRLAGYGPTGYGEMWVIEHAARVCGPTTSATVPLVDMLALLRMAGWGEPLEREPEEADCA